MVDVVPDLEWRDLSRRAALQSHRLIGWIYWDPRAIANYAALGVPDGIGYYIATRGATLGHAGNDVVTAAFYSIHPGFVAFGLDQCRAATTFEAVASVVTPPSSTVFANTFPRSVTNSQPWPTISGPPPMHCRWPVGCCSRPHVPGRGRTTIACCRPGWRSTASVNGEGTRTGRSRSPKESAVLPPESSTAPGATTTVTGWRGSRGADDAALEAGFAELEARGLAEQHTVNDAGIEYRQALEDRLDDLSTAAWRHLGEDATRRFLELIEPVGGRLVERIDATAGPNWMPAARDREPRS